MTQPAINIQEAVANLKQIDPALVQQRAGGNSRGQELFFDYLPWYTVTDILDEHAPDWSSTIKNVQAIGDILVTTVAMTVAGITREGVGTGSAKDEKGIKKSEHDALKRAALKFGVGRHLYKKQARIERKAGEGSRKASEPARPQAPPTDPIADSLNNLISTKQLGLINKLAKDLGLEPDEVSQNFLKANVQELSRKAASWLIEMLNSEEFKKQANNVIQMPGRAQSNDIDQQAQAMSDSGAVIPITDGYAVKDSINGVSSEFKVSRRGTRISCTCGDFKTNLLINKIDNYRCVHIAAAEIFGAGNIPA